MATPNDGGGTARPLDDEVWDEERWSVPDAALFVTASSLALWAAIIALLWRLIG